MTEQKQEQQELPTAAKARRCTECNGIVTILQGIRSEKLACYPREGDGRECSQSTNISDKPLNERIADDIELVRRSDVEQLIQNKIGNMEDKRDGISNNDLQESETARKLFSEYRAVIGKLEEVLEEVQNTDE